MRPLVRGQECGGHGRVGQYLVAAHDSLMNRDGDGANGFDRADDDEVVTEIGGLSIFDRDFGDCISASGCVQLGPLVDLGAPDHVGPGALHELQIIRVIDDAGGVGVFEIDGERKAMLAADKAAAVRLVEIAAHAGAVARGDSEGQTAA